jgi:hypothetical protein
MSPGQVADQGPVLGQVGQRLRLGLGEERHPLRRSEQTPRGPEDRLQVAHGVVGGTRLGGVGIGCFE